jgi:hypothetical protein
VPPWEWRKAKPGQSLNLSDRECLICYFQNRSETLPSKTLRDSAQTGRKVFALDTRAMPAATFRQRSVPPTAHRHWRRGRSIILSSDPPIPSQEPVPATAWPAGFPHHSFAASASRAPIQASTPVCPVSIPGHDPFRQRVFDHYNIVSDVDLPMASRKLHGHNVGTVAASNLSKTPVPSSNPLEIPVDLAHAPVAQLDRATVS